MFVGAQLTSVVSVMQQARSSSDTASSGQSLADMAVSLSGSGKDNGADSEAIRHRQEAANGGNNAARLSTAATALNQAGEILNEMQTLATQASSDTLNSSDRANLDQNFQALSKQLDGIANNTQFNGENVLSGAESTVQSGGGLTINDPDLQGVASGLSGNSLATGAGAQAAVDALAGAQEELGAEQASLGAQASTVDRAIDRSMLQAANSENGSDDLDVSDVMRMKSQVLAEQIKTATSAKMLDAQRVNAHSVGKLLDS